MGLNLNTRVASELVLRNEERQEVAGRIKNSSLNLERLETSDQSEFKSGGKLEDQKKRGECW